MKIKSFTLIELLVVIVIIGILAGVIIVSTSSSISKANFAKGQAFSNTVQQELLLNLVSEWTFDNSSNPGEDTWGNNDGVINSSPALATKDQCVYGTCLNFDGIDDGINCVLDFYPNQTVSFWFNANDLSRSESLLGKIISFEGIEGYNWMFYRNSHWTIGNLSFLIYYTKTDNTRGNIAPQINFQTGNWYLATLINKSNGEYKVYINGELKTESKPSNFSSWRYSASSLYIANIWGKYKGYIDDVRIYNAALSSSQIKQNYIAGLNSLLANNNISKEEYDQRLNSLSFK